MNIRTKLLQSVCCITAAIVLYGCGSDYTNVTKFPSGKVAMGQVRDALIFADNVSGGVRFKIDSGEETATSTASLADGSFTLKGTPSYNYILVSQGGTDIITKQAAVQMLAPAGAKNITSLTTLVTLDPTGTVKTKLEALAGGASYDSDISASATPALLNLAKSIDLVVQSITATTGTTINDAQTAVVQAQTMQAISATIAALPSTAATTTTLSTPSSLTTTLVAATKTAAVNIHNSNSNITIDATAAGAIATKAVDAASQAVLGLAGSTTSGSAALTTALSQPAAAEITLIQNVGSLTAAVLNTATTIATAGGSATITKTPDVYNPPIIIVYTPVTVPSTTSGSSGGSGATGGAGNGQGF